MRTTWWQFHQHFTRKLWADILRQKLESWNIIRESCSKHCCTKNSRIIGHLLKSCFYEFIKQNGGQEGYWFCVIVWSFFVTSLLRSYLQKFDFGSDIWILDFWVKPLRFRKMSSKYLAMYLNYVYFWFYCLWSRQYF